MCCIKKIGILGLLVFIASSLSGQSDSLEIGLLTQKNAQGDVMLRWAPANETTWNWAKTHQYIVERYTFREDTIELSDSLMRASKVILSDSITALPEADWESLADSSDMAGVAASALYGEQFDVISTDSFQIGELYDISRESVNQYNFGMLAADLDFQVACDMGMGFVDTSAQSNFEYVYVVRLNQDTLADYSSPGASVIAVDSSSNLPTPNGLYYTGSDKRILLQWSLVDTRYDYTAYNVERSTNGTSFSKLNEKPIVPMTRTDGLLKGTFVDSVANNTTTYIYRIQGISPFGLTGPYSDTIHAIGAEQRIFLNSLIDSATMNANDQVELNWNVVMNDTSVVSGYRVYRADEVEGDYELISDSLIAPGTQSFVDPSPQSSNYYKIVTIDKNGFEYESTKKFVQKADSIPPAKPIGLAAQVDKNGEVHLYWTPGTEEDLKGYHVFISNHPDSQYSVASTELVQDTNFYEYLELQTLAEKVYFKISAFDNRYNESEWSDYLEVDRPDIIPPAKPALLNVFGKQHGILIGWRYSHSKDVVSHKLQKKTPAERYWTTVLETTGPKSPDTVHSFLDTLVDYRNTYTYRLVAEDEAGNRSLSLYLSGRSIYPALNGTIFNLGYDIIDISGSVTPAVFLSNNDVFLYKELLIHWNCDRPTEVVQFEIYRSACGDSLRLHTTFDMDYYGTVPPHISPPPQKFYYLDDDLLIKRSAVNDPNNGSGSGGSGGGSGSGVGTPGFNGVNTDEDTYIYKIIAKYEDGTSSRISDPIIIQL